MKIKQIKEKHNYIVVFGIIFCILLASIVQADYTQGEYWDFISGDNPTTTLTNDSHNVNIGENETTWSKLNVEGNMSVEGNHTADGSILLKNGNTNNLSLAFKYEPGTGIYRPSNGQIAFLVFGNVAFNIGDSLNSCSRDLLMLLNNELQFRSGSQFIRSENATTLSINSYYILFNGTLIENVSKMETTSGSQYGTNCVVTGITTHDGFVYGGQGATYTGTITGGDLASNDDLIITDDAYIPNDIYLGQYIYHYGDVDTYMQYTTDLMRLVIGNRHMMKFVEGASDYIEVNDYNTNIDFRINGDTKSDVFTVDASADSMGGKHGFFREGRKVSGTCTLGLNDSMIYADSDATGDIEITIPSSGDLNGQIITITNIGSNYTNISESHSEPISGDSTVVLANRFDSVTLVACKDYSGWLIIADTR